MNQTVICRKSVRKGKSNPEKHPSSDSCMRTSVILQASMKKKFFFGAEVSPAVLTGQSGGTVYV